MSQAKTLYQKIWDAHVVKQLPGHPAVLYIDCHLIHEVTSPQAFQGLRDRGLKLRRPDKTVATMDHSIPTTPKNPDGSFVFTDEEAQKQVSTLEKNCAEFDVRLFGVGCKEQGIVHVMGPEQGLTQPGMTIVCGDSHTATHGAFGALAFGIGTSEIEHVFATQCLLQTPSKTMEVRVEGQLAEGLSAKDIILAVIAKIGVGGATAHVIEYTGSAIRALSMEGRMTLCNMSIEAGARAGMVAPDETTFAYLKGKPFVSKGAEFEKAVARWQQLASDPGATYDTTVVLKAEDIQPMVTYGTNPGMGVGIGETLPKPGDIANPDDRQELEEAFAYMGLTAGQPMKGVAIDVAFIGSCTNSRIEDLREAARYAKNHQVAKGVRALVVPGSHLVKEQAEAEGLDKIFTQAGFEWREPGCSMCIAMNGDQLSPGQVCASTSNRNFKGRQGIGGRTLLMSPAMAAAAAVSGKLVDIREWSGRSGEALSYV